MPNGPPSTTTSPPSCSASQMDPSVNPAHPSPQPPGQERAYPQPTRTGKIPFEYAPTSLKGETYYLLWGDLSSSTHPPLICLHGGPGGGHEYILPISLIYLDYGIPVLMYDQIGCGGSTLFPDKKGDTTFWTMELFMAELENVKSYFAIIEFDLLGQSWGGMLAGEYAIERQPKGLRKLIISDSPADMESWVKCCNELRAGLPEQVREALDRGERDGKMEEKEYLDAVMYFYGLHLCRVDPWPREYLKAVEHLMGDGSAVYETMCGPSEFSIVGSLKGWSVRGRLGEITGETAPGGVLVMNGYHDEAQPETQGPFFYEPKARTKWVTYGLSSHMPMLEETEKYVNDLGTFLTS